MKICLSGIECSREHSLALLRSGAKSVLGSFYYSGWEGRGKTETWREVLAAGTFRLIDSGAFTFRAAALGLANAKLSVEADLDRYVDGYKKWLTPLVRSGLADYWVELDVGLIAGQDWLRKHRNDMIACGLGSGLVKVWHSEDNHTWQDWLDLIEESLLPGRSRLVAIEGHNPSRPQHPYERYLAAAYKRGVRVHAFKMTQYDDLIRWPFYSVDSTTWLSPVRFGSVVKRRGHGGLEAVDRSQMGETIPFPRYGGSARDRHRTSVSSVKAWVDLEDRITSIWKSRGVDYDQLDREIERGQSNMGQRIDCADRPDDLAAGQPVESQ